MQNFPRTSNAYRLETPPIPVGGAVGAVLQRLSKVSTATRLGALTPMCVWRIGRGGRGYSFHA